MIDAPKSSGRSHSLQTMAPNSAWFQPGGCVLTFLRILRFGRTSCNVLVAAHQFGPGLRHGLSTSPPVVTRRAVKRDHKSSVWGEVRHACRLHPPHNQKPTGISSRPTLDRPGQGTGWLRVASSLVQGVVVDDHRIRRQHPFSCGTPQQNCVLAIGKRQKAGGYPSTSARLRNTGC